MQDLDQKEIDELAERLYRLMDSIDSIICKRMTETYPTFNIDNQEYIEEISGNIQPTKKLNYDLGKCQIKPNDPCPCGSGKKYITCHGKKRNQIRRRR